MGLQNTLNVVLVPCNRIVSQIHGMLLKPLIQLMNAIKAISQKQVFFVKILMAIYATICNQNAVSLSNAKSLTDLNSSTDNPV